MCPCVPDPCLERPQQPHPESPKPQDLSTAPEPTHSEDGSRGSRAGASNKGHTQPCSVHIKANTGERGHGRGCPGIRGELVLGGGCYCSISWSGHCLPKCIQLVEIYQDTFAKGTLFCEYTPHKQKLNNQRGGTHSESPPGTQRRLRAPAGFPDYTAQPLSQGTEVGSVFLCVHLICVSPAYLLRVAAGPRARCSESPPEVAGHGSQRLGGPRSPCGTHPPLSAPLP